ncbi:hypothetical protein SteCoe_14534 [Stentor coeruleus]|uniref:RING-type domain-containing protein n=1 Tax=Stentor coeruleus TaxID=5963 RepID=A0A1R2C5X1_9CILI|nr:hypothetical protein SteCoe_14534 [Stentor coeruleus]
MFILILTLHSLAYGSKESDEDYYSLGSWSGKLSEFTHSSGRIYVQIDKSSKGADLLMTVYNGDWESDPYIYFYGKDLYYSSKTIEGEAYVYPVDNSIMAYCTSKVSITESSEIKAKVEGKNCTISMNIKVSKLTYYDSNKQSFAFFMIFLILKLGEFYVVKAMKEQCSRSTVSMSINISCIILSAIIDIFFLLWPVVLVQSKKINLILYLFMCILPIMILREKSIIYKKVVDVQQGVMRRNKFSTYMLIGTLYIILLNNLYEFNLIVSNCIFIPHIHKNYQRESFKNSLITYMILEQLLITLYFTLFQWNFMVWEPDGLLSFIVILLVSGQIVALYWKKIAERQQSLGAPLLPRNSPPNVVNRIIQHCETCPICLYPLGTIDLLVTRCEHAFHNSCLQPWLELQTWCPVCRASIEGQR